VATTAIQYTLIANGKDIFVERHYGANQARLIYNGIGNINFALKINGSMPLIQLDIYPRRENV